TAEVTYSTDAAVLHRGRLNATSTRGKQDAARYLATLAPGPAWPKLIETASWKVVDAVRQGRPAILLGEAPEPPGDGSLLPPLLLPNDPVIIFGDGGSAKSYLELAATPRSAAGWTACAASSHSTRSITSSSTASPWLAPARQRMPRPRSISCKPSA